MGGTIAPIKKMVMTGGMGDGSVLTTLEIVDFRHADVTEMDIPEVNGCFDTVYKGKIWDSHEPYFNFVFFFSTFTWICLLDHQGSGKTMQP